MLGTKLAKRYSKSLIDLATEKNVLPAIAADMELIMNTVDENRDLGNMLRNPLIHADKKAEILRQIFSAKVNDMTMSFIDIIARKRRESNLPAIAKEVVDQYRTIRGYTQAILTSAVGIDETLRKQIIDIVKNETKSEVELIEKINPDLIGGFILRFDDNQYDTTVSRSLRSLRRNFSKNLYIGKIKNK